MGISSNQARFLTLTSRQVDLEFRTQQICQRRLRLSSELERVATDYNNQISNRQMYTFNTNNSGISNFNITNIQNLKDSNGNNYKILSKDTGNVNSSTYAGIKFITGQGIQVQHAAVTGADAATALSNLKTTYGKTYADAAAARNEGWTLSGSTYSFASSIPGAASANDAAATTAALTALGGYADVAAANAAGWQLTLSGAAGARVGTFNYTTPDVTLGSLGLDSTAQESDTMEAALRAGVITIATEADEYTQKSVDAGGVDYELRDWRTLPDIADELYKADDVDAENKYDRIVGEINAQDKKLQLEQAQLEVEYKAVSSEKEAVKKILDTNAQSSFKYFS